MKRLLFLLTLSTILFSFVDAQIYVTISGDTTKIWDSNISWSCFGIFYPITRISQDTLYITEYDTMAHATCSCYYTFCTSFIGLSTGTYTALIFRQWHYQYNGKVIDHIDTAGSVIFTLSNTPTLSYRTTYNQSSCFQSPQSVEGNTYSPIKFAMLSNYPNPFNPNTIIRYTIPNKCFVSLSIYNIVGQRVATLVEEQKNAGDYEINFTKDNLASGIYFCRLNYGTNILSNKIVLLK